VEELHVVGVLGGDMRRLMKQHPEISMRLVIALGRRLRETNERLARQSFQTVQSRVANVLLELVQQTVGEARRGAGEDVTDGAAGTPPRDILITSTQADVAKLAGSSRESASRFLAVLERAGVISQGRGRLVVHDPRALEAYVF
jgi:CRP/FNR family transcriptional regulator